MNKKSQLKRQMSRKGAQVAKLPLQRLSNDGSSSFEVEDQGLVRMPLVCSSKAFEPSQLVCSYDEYISKYSIPAKYFAQCSGLPLDEILRRAFNDGVQFEKAPTPGTLWWNFIQKYSQPCPDEVVVLLPADRAKGCSTEEYYPFFHNPRCQVDFRTKPRPTIAYAMTGKRNKRRRKKNREGLSGGTKLSDCAKGYLSVLEDPFSGAVSCVPTTTNFPTLKHSVRSQGTLYTGTLGVGYVCVSPIVGMWTSAEFVNVSGVGYDGAGIASVAATTGKVANGSNTPYATTLTRQQMQGRVVACGLRVRNTTALLNRGGSVVGIESQGHASLVNNTMADVLQQDSADKMAATSDAWHSVVWHPQDDDEYDYFDTSELTGAAIAPVLAFVMQAPGVTAAGTQQQYEYEVYLAFEAKGAVVHGQSPSYSDAVGLSAVQNSTATIAARKPQSGDRGPWVQNALRTVQQLAASTMTVVRTVAPIAVPAIAAYTPVPRLAASVVPRIALAATNSTAVPFPVIFDTGVPGLYAVDYGDGTGDGCTKDGHRVAGYVGTLDMDTGADLRVFRLNPMAWRTGVHVPIEGPVVTDQSLQHAVHVLLRGTRALGVAYTGMVSANGLIRDSGSWGAKRSFVNASGGYLEGGEHA